MLIRFLRFGAMILTTFLFVACATGPRALNPRGAEEPNLMQHGVVAMSLDMDNQFNPDWQPWKLGGRFTGRAYDAEKKESVFFETSLTYYPGPIFGVGDGVKKGRKDMVAIVILPPGKYRLTSIVGSSMPGLVGAGIHFPVFSDQFVIEANRGVYIGHVGIVAKEKSLSDKVKMDEMVGRYKYLGDTSLIGQGMSKFGKTAPVLTISNRFDNAVKEIKEDYPYLKSTEFSNKPIWISMDGTPYPMK